MPIASEVSVSPASLPDALAYDSLANLSEQIRLGRISPVAAVEMQLQRIGALDARLHSYVHVMAESGRAAAETAEQEIARGFYRGPLHGVPIAVKDLCFTHDAPTSGGMPLLHAQTNPGYDATVVARLRAAGAIVLGKLALTEGATGQHHPAVTAPVNPWGADYWTGVSSSGSGVALAAGLCFGALGSDTAGSIRLPSACCGITGLKPTWGRISRHGIFHFAESMDHLGPMARSAEDVALLMNVLAGADPADPTSASVAVPNYAERLRDGPRGLRIGIDRELAFANSDPDIIAATEALLDGLSAMGARVLSVRLPDLTKALSCFMPILMVEIALAHRETYPEHAESYGPALRAMLDIGHKLSALDLAQAQQIRREFRSALQHLFDDIDTLVLPVFRRRVPTLAENEQHQADPKRRGAAVEFTVPFDLSGNPSLTVPAGIDSRGLPIGIQLIGAHFAEDVLLRAGHAWQQYSDWHTRRPPLE